MALTGKRTFVGFGFGAIQAGLFIYEAFRSGNFGRLVVAEVLPDIVLAIERAGGHYSVNIAHRDRVEAAGIGPVELVNPDLESGRARLIDAVAVADEIATAVPSVQQYVSDGPGSVHRILAQGLRNKASRGGPPAVLYAAENHNHAAELLEAAIAAEIPADERPGVSAHIRYLNTVIGKMSGVVAAADDCGRSGLATIAPGIDRVFLVESFNRILISRIRFDAGPFTRGIACFEEKDDLLPFEEAKLFGHNATHALAAYLGAIRGARWIANLREFPLIMSILRAAFIEESGGALVRKHAGIDRLFTPDGYGEYADDLLARMINPFLQDSVERVGRDPGRKLAWDDRIIGTMRVALRMGITPRRYALGAAAALAALDRSSLAGDRSAASWLEPLWEGSSPEASEKKSIVDLIDAGRRSLRRWIDSDYRQLG